MAASRRDPFRHPRRQDIRVTPRRDTTVHSLARDIRPDRVTLRRDMAAQDIRPDRVTPRRDMARSLARDIRPDRVTTVARAGHSRSPAAGRSLTRMSSACAPSTAAIASQLLILDDWGLEPLDASARRDLYEILEERYGRRSTILTSQIPVAAGQWVPWHYHTEISDSFVCLEGPMVVETRAPRHVYRLLPGERCAVPPKTAHYVHGEADAACRFLIVQGVGVYDFVAVGAR